MRTWWLVGLFFCGGGCASQTLEMGGSAGAAGAGSRSSGGSPGSGGVLSGGSPATGGTATAGAAGCPSATGCELSPPPYIDISRCASVVDDGTPTAITDCIGCCQEGGFLASSFINDHQCTCANLPNTTDPVTCAMALGNVTECGTCCQNAGYTRWSWSSSSCSCLGQPDDQETCAATVGLVDPERACSICCLNHGYLAAGYFDLAPSCTCTA